MIRKIKAISIVCVTIILFGINLHASETLNDKMSGIQKGKYKVQINTLNGFVDYLKCDEIRYSEKNSIGCIKNSKTNYMIFKDKKEFDDICINNFKGTLRDVKSDNKWIEYRVCTNKTTKEQIVATKTKVLEDKKDIYVVSLTNETAMSQNEPLLLHFMQTVINTSDKKLITNF